MYNLIFPSQLGSAFSAQPSLRDIRRNLLGSIPFLGIYIGKERILRVSTYVKELGSKGINQVVLQEIDMRPLVGPRGLASESIKIYKIKHYIRGTMEILGLGIALTICELALALLLHCLLGFLKYLSVFYMVLKS